MQSHSKVLLFATGGTGGHLFPAQALARQLKAKNPHLEILFVGKGLGTNPFFQKEEFAFREIESGRLIWQKIFSEMRKITKGLFQSLRIIKTMSPKLVIGCGSFYSFPLLLAARWKGIAYILLEPNAHLGKVNRLFSSNALLTAIQFAEIETQIKGRTKKALMPTFSQEKAPSFLPSAARKSYDLDPDLFTLLIFGGSAGAERINQTISQVDLPFPFQILHLTGDERETEELKKSYLIRQIKAHVKSFENQMIYAWKSCDLVIARSGAATLSELIDFEIPGILIPWPGSSENHQKKNAEVMEKLGIAIHLAQEKLTPQLLSEKIAAAKEKIDIMRQSISKFKILGQREDLCKIVEKFLI